LEGERFSYCFTENSKFGLLNFFETKGYPPKVVLLRIGNMDRKNGGDNNSGKTRYRRYGKK